MRRGEQCLIYFSLSAFLSLSVHLYISEKTKPTVEPREEHRARTGREIKGAAWRELVDVARERFAWRWAGDEGYGWSRGTPSFLHIPALQHPILDHFSIQVSPVTGPQGSPSHLLAVARR